MIRASLLVLVMLLVLQCAACSTGDDLDRRPQASAIRPGTASLDVALVDFGGGRSLVVDRQSATVTPDAALVGTLVFNEAGCLSLRRDDGSVSLVVWPSETAPSGEEEITVPGEGQFLVGQNVEIRGTTQEEMARPESNILPDAIYNECKPAQVSVAY